MLKPITLGLIGALVATMAAPDLASAAKARRPVASAHNCKPAAHKGSAGGAVLGALLGQALGHNTTSTVIGAGVGAAAGHNLRYSNCRKRYG